jgi:hypothetical protein
MGPLGEENLQSNAHSPGAQCWLGETSRITLFVPFPLCLMQLWTALGLPP